VLPRFEADSSWLRAEERGAPTNPPPVEIRRLQTRPEGRIQTLLRRDCRPRWCRISTLSPTMASDDSSSSRYALPHPPALPCSSPLYSRWACVRAVLHPLVATVVLREEGDDGRPLASTSQRASAAVEGRSHGLCGWGLGRIAFLTCCCCLCWSA
jgi:hypothetical protein